MRRAKSKSVSRRKVVVPSPRGRVALALALMGVGFVAWQVAVQRPAQRASSTATVGFPEVGPEERRLLDSAERRPGDPRPHLELAQFYTGQRRAAEAVWEYQEAGALQPEALPAQIGLAIALGQLRLHDLAIARLEALVRRQPRAPDPRRVLAEFYLVTGRPERSVAVLTGGPSGAGPGVRRRTSPDALLALGRMRLALGQPAAAEPVFREAARHSPASAETDYWLGRAALALGRGADARRFWERGGRRAPVDPRFPFNLGLLDARDPASGAADRAAEAFAEALRRAPGFVAARVQRGLLEHRRGRPQEAARELLLAVRSAPSDPDAHRSLADVLGALGETGEAHRHRGVAFSLTDRPAMALAEYEHLRAAREAPNRLADPDPIDVTLLISQSYIQMQQNERAAAVVSEALQRHPSTPELYESLASLYILTHSRTEAEQTCVAWLRAQPDAARPHWMLGRVLLGNNRVEDAVREFEAARAREPGEAEYCFALGGALARQTGPAAQQRALSLLRQAVALRGEVPEYHYQLGAALQQSGQWEPARREFLAALSLDPSEARAYNGLAQVSQGLRRPHQVALWAAATRAVQDRLREVKFQRRAAGQRPSDASAYYALAATLLRDGEVAQAQSQLEQAVLLRPGWREARQRLARVTGVREAL